MNRAGGPGGPGGPEEPRTQLHWTRTQRNLLHGVIGAGGFLLGVLAALLVVGIDGDDGDGKEPRPITVTRTETVTTETTTTAPPTRPTTPTAPTGTVPDVVGDDAADAERELRDAGYDVNPDNASVVCFVDPASCVVTDQDPAGGTELAEGETVTIVLDTG